MSNKSLNHITGNDDYFIIDPREGLLIATESLDREEFPSYTLTVNVCTLLLFLSVILLWIPDRCPIWGTLHLVTAL